MGLLDLFRASQNREYRERIRELIRENERLKQLITPEQKSIIDLQSKIDELNKEKACIAGEIDKKKLVVTNLDNEIAKKKIEILELDDKKVKAIRSEIQKLEGIIQEKKREIIVLDDEALYQSFGIYTPMYRLTSSAEYATRLSAIRDKQKAFIKDDNAVTYPTNWSLNGSLAEGKRLMKDNVKQILRAFNNECDAIIDKVKFNNIQAIEDRIKKAYDQLNNLNKRSEVSIKHSYLLLKLEELHLCYEYELKKQEEKEEQQRIREKLREEQKVHKEIEEARKKLEKEKTHFKQAIEEYRNRLAASNSEDEKAILASKVAELEEKLDEIAKNEAAIDYRERNTRAGYVYVVSNIGAFGEDVFKIGVTRRLEPEERVKELGDASVPFKFDTHALIFSEDAPALEYALHKQFDNRRLNKINGKREFFRVGLDEIEAVVKKHHNKAVEFTKTPEADEYRQSLLLNDPITEAAI